MLDWDARKLVGRREVVSVPKAAVVRRLIHSGFRPGGLFPALARLIRSVVGEVTRGLGPGRAFAQPQAGDLFPQPTGARLLAILLIVRHGYGYFGRGFAVALSCSIAARHIFA